MVNAAPQYDYHEAADLPYLLPLMAAIENSYQKGQIHRAIVPLRTLISPPRHGSTFGVMPAWCPEANLFITKVASLVTGGPSRESSVKASVCVFDGTCGRPISILDGKRITNLKCAAVSALVTDYCAADNAESLCVFGSGVLAWQQIMAVMSVRRIKRITLCSRQPERRSALCRKFIQTFGEETTITAATDAKAALAAADIICTATTSDQPLFQPIPLAPRVHINCMGAHTPHSRELPLVLLKQSTLIVEDLPTAIEEAGVLHRNAIDLYRLVTSETRWYKSCRSIFSSTGHGYLDLLTVSFLLSQQKSSAVDKEGEK